MTFTKTFFKKLLLVALVVLGSWVSTNITVSTSNSLKKRVFWATSDNPSLRGEYGKFRFSDSSYLRERGVTETFTKRVGCIAGDELVLELNNFFCNGVFIANQIKTGSDGKPLPAFEFNGVIPENMAFMVGDNPLSGDSRYMG